MGAEGHAAVNINAHDRQVIMELRADRFDAASFESLKDRAEAFDGQVAVDAAPEALVRVSLPLNPAPLP
jgi:hypothetical protein